MNFTIIASAKFNVKSFHSFILFLFNNYFFSFKCLALNIITIHFT